MPVFYKKIRTSNIYEEETSLNSDPSKSLLEQTKAQVLNSQEPKALSTQKAQEAHIVTDLKIKTKLAEKESTKDIPKELNNSLIENHIIDTNMIVDPLTILYNDSKVAESSFISNNDNEFQLVMSKKKHKV
ncbi:3233_t:CDS:2 [Cetraspora pellucida]|uniref:3233_t:CDS:1 n=1 Tax=Cetraspora pellucida TaxID=1433469 RepID=A0A9N9I1A4_9GLOM|nr:3233_t:CDS:2 [Cetraspora pellucida]